MKGKRTPPSRPALRLDRLVDLLAEYEDAEPGDPAQFARFVALRDAFPGIDFPIRLEPRTVVRRYLADRQRRDGLSFSSDVDAAVRGGRLRPETIATLVSILAEGRFELAIATLYDAAAQIAKMPAGGIADQAFADLVALAERRTTTDLNSLLFRLSEQNIVRPSAMFAALQAIATHNPSSLGEALRTNAAWIENPVIDSEAFAYCLSDVTSRAGPAALLGALATRKPMENGKLFAASFGYSSSPFEMVRIGGHDPDEQQIKVLCNGEALSLAGILSMRDQSDWLAQVSAAMRSATRNQSVNSPGVIHVSGIPSIQSTRVLGSPVAAMSTLFTAPARRPSILSAMKNALGGRGVREPMAV